MKMSHDGVMVSAVSQVVEASGSYSASDIILAICAVLLVPLIFWWLTKQSSISVKDDE